MPNRILKDSICTSPNIDTLSREAEVFFYRLLVQCDDFGRMDARPAILRAKCYPLQVDTVSKDSIKQWLGELVSAELVIVYTVDGGDYLQMRTWDKHQQIRAKRSKYPDMKSSDINCNQMQSDVPVIQSNPIQTRNENTPVKPAQNEVVVVDPTRYRHACDMIHQNGFGMMTPILSEQVHTMLAEYPDEWIEKAFEVSVKANKRRLDYVIGVLENWRRNGFDSRQAKAPPLPPANGIVAGFSLDEMLGNGAPA